MCFVRRSKHAVMVLLIIAIMMSILLLATYVWADSPDLESDIAEAPAYLSATESYTPGITVLEEPESFTLVMQDVNDSDISTFGVSQSGLTVTYQERVDTFLRPDSNVIGNGTPTEVNPACAIKYIQDDWDSGESLDADGHRRCRYVYCTNFEKDSPAGQKLTNVGYLNRFVHYVMYHGAMYYGETSRHAPYSTGNWKFDYLVTQMAIHVVNEEFTLDNLIKGINKSNASEADKKLVIDRITAMVQDAYAVGNAAHDGWDSDGWFRADDTKYTKFYLSEVLDKWTFGGDGYYYTDWISPILTTKGGYYANYDISYISHEASDGALINKKYADTSFSPYRLAIPWETYEEWRKTGKTVTTSVTVKFPSHWKVSQFATSGGTNFQNVCFITSLAQQTTYRASISIELPQATGSVSVKKVASNSELVNNNPNYSLEGAVFELYKEETDGTLVKQDGTYVTDKTGCFTILNLPVGNYRLKEISAPKGYELKSEYSELITVAVNQNKSVILSNVPENISIPILLRKQDSETGLETAQGKGTLANAEFTVRYYTEIMDTDPALLGKIPERTWVIKTNQFGRSGLADVHYVSGSEFYKNASGDVVCPYGTLTICETKPPEGYKVDEKIHVVKIYENTSGTITHSSIPIIKEQVNAVKIIKKQDGADVYLPEVTFELEYPDGTKETAVTDENGEIVFKGLQVGRYILKEIASRENYVLSNDIVTFTVDSSHDIVNGKVISAKDGSSAEIVFEYDFNGNGVITFGNKTESYHIQIHKTDDKDIPLDGAEFTIYHDEKCSDVFTKGITSNGSVCLENLQPGKKYYLVETKVPEGYKGEINEEGNPVLYEIYAEVYPDSGFVLCVNGEKYTTGQVDNTDWIYFSETAGKRIINMKIINTSGMSLPETGSIWMIPLTITGVVSMIAALWIKKRENE